MTVRTTKRTVTFARPFRLAETGDEYPAGRYFIETDEEQVDELSFPFYRRTSTMMQLIADPLRPGITETVVIDPLQLEAALEADAASVSKAELETSYPATLSERPRETGGPAEDPVVKAEVKPVAP